MGDWWTKVYPDTPEYPQIASKACMVVQEKVRISDVAYAEHYPRTPACMAIRRIVLMGGMAFDTPPSNDAQLNKELEELGLLEGLSDIENEYDYGERLPIFRSHSPSEDEITERIRMLDSVLLQPVLCIRRNSPIEDCYCVACEPGVLGNHY